MFQSLNIYNVEFGAPPSATPDADTSTALNVYRCPSNNPPITNMYRDYFATSNYRAVSGPETLTEFIPDQDMGGVMWQNSKIKPEDITDGLAETVVIGEVVFEQAAAAIRCHLGRALGRHARVTGI